MQKEEILNKLQELKAIFKKEVDFVPNSNKKIMRDLRHV